MTAATPPGAHFQLYRAAPSAPIRWRLLGGNHRPIGRGTEDFDSRGSARQSIADLIARLPELEGVISRVPDNQWVWRLHRQGRPVAEGAHSYDRQIRAAHAQLQFLDRARTARIDEAVLVTAARRWRSLPGRVLSAPPEVRR